MKELIIKIIAIIILIINVLFVYGCFLLQKIKYQLKMKERWKNEKVRIQEDNIR
jgi:hypothetical protein